MSATRGLYTPEVLATAMELADYPWDAALPLHGSARSRTCGSAIDMALETDGSGNIVRAAVRPHACAIGQAAAALFLRGATGKDLSAIEAARDTMAAWLTGGDTLPDWPGTALLEPARAHKARHPAILLAWDAALAALRAA